MQSLLFFNKEGDNLNFRWKAGDERWEGDLLFHENSDDTFKTIGIYLFESIPSIEFESPGELQLEKFQLFNEYRFRYSGNIYTEEPITLIEAANSDSNFYSKWIYGADFEKKFPIGTEIIFDKPIFEFTNVNRSYTVVTTKKNAILILSAANNDNFESLYGTQLTITASYTEATITGVNAIGVYNYVDSQLTDNLSSWNEPDFYSKYFNGRKITVINTENNDGVYTVDNIDLFDKIYYSYDLPISNYTQSQNLAIELVLRTDVPIVYREGLTLTGNKIVFDEFAPISLKPGVEFVLPFSSLNTLPLMVDSIPQFLGNSNQLLYVTQSLAVFNNLVYECIQAYTWSATTLPDFGATPEDVLFWRPTKYLPLTTTVVFESFLSTEVRLTTNKFIFPISFTQSSMVTLASAAEQFRLDFDFFNIELYYEDFALRADLIYPTEYAQINYYLFTQSTNFTGVTSSGIRKIIYEQTVGIEETLKPEVNENVCENFLYNIVFTDLDEYGLKILINGQEYNEQIDFIFVGGNIDLDRTIDRTLNNWLVAYYGELATLGILAKLQYIGGGTSFYHNSIQLKTEYPNVPLQFTVRVGITADYYIEHSDVIFYDMSNYLDININGRSYGQAVALTNGVPDILTALSEWVDTYSNELDDYGIFVENINRKLVFRVKRQNQRVDYEVRVGKGNLPGLELYKVVNKIQGNFGALMTSNSITLIENSNLSFEDFSFATGQIVSINNTIYPYNNQEYNILYLGPSNLILSYQGPFWGTTDPYCDVSPYVSVAFNSGFGATGCLPPVVATYSAGGNFNLLQFTHSFSLYTFSPNLYTTTNYSVPGNSNLVDISYLQISGNMYVLGDNLSIYDGETANFIQSVGFTGSAPSTQIMMKFNSYNNYLYCLSSTKIYVFDPIIDALVHQITLTYTSNSIEFSKLNGDIYVTYDNANIVDIWAFNNFTNTPTNTVSCSGNTKKMVYNESENDLYVTQDDDVLIRIDATTRLIVASYPIVGLFDEIFYEPINSSVYYFDSVGLKNFNNGVTVSVSGVGTSSFNDLIFNHNGGNIVLSQLTSYSKISSTNILESTFNGPDFGRLAISNFDGDIYLPSLNSAKVLVLDTVTGVVKQSRTINQITEKLIFQPERNSMFGIQSISNTLIEISVNLGTQIILGDSAPFSTINDNQFGALGPDYVPYTDIWLKTREYIRKPRENYNDEPFVKYVWKWQTDEFPQMFLYDISGDQLSTTGPYAYVGEKPLSLVSLNRKPNKDLNRVSLPEYQQTIFSEVVATLPHVDDEDDFSIIPSPIQTFIGFNSQDEGPMSSRLLLIKREDISFTIAPNISNNNILKFKTVFNSVNTFCEISFDSSSDSVFTLDETGKPRGLKVGQLIKIFITDDTNIKNKYFSRNNGKEFKIREINTRKLILQPIDLLDAESNVITDYPKPGQTTYMKVRFKVLDKTIGRFNVYGQTEIEDFRYKIELNNNGHNIDPEDVYIFKPYDINEQGIDWTYLNRKRKELMMVRHDIFPYVGSYKAIINAINFFGYNDLELYEYYRNVNTTSGDFGKLFKVEIPDIFDNRVEGWKENDFIKGTFPNENFENTNLFNLTYKITDKEGNNLLFYSLAEVIIKLEGLKNWLEKRVVPLTHTILDITGRADWVGSTDIVHRNYDIKILNVKQSMTPIDFNLNEAYLMPVNSGSTVYTCHLDFSTSTNIDVPDYFTINIRTYKTYKEWNPFVTYNFGDKVIYFGKIYYSEIPNNRIKNPRKYEKVLEWIETVNYTLGQYAKYDNLIYQYISASSSFEISGTTSNAQNPFQDIRSNIGFASWLDMTEWREIDLEPVQYLSDYRTSTHPYNFTIDTNIDPFVVIEVTSDNGYGQIYTTKKNYEIRSSNDLFTGYKGDPIKPFSPIIQINTSVIQNPTPIFNQLSISPASSQL